MNATSDHSPSFYQLTLFTFPQSTPEDFTAIPPPQDESVQVLSASAEAAAALPLEDEGASTAVEAAAEAASPDEPASPVEEPVAEPAAEAASSGEWQVCSQWFSDCKFAISFQNNE